jgi:hypothetical protein
MLTVSLRNIDSQELDAFLDAFDRLAPDYVSGGAYRNDDIKRLRSNLMFIAASETITSVDEWVAKTEEHYAAVKRNVDAGPVKNEHRLGAHEYGLCAA